VETEMNRFDNIDCMVGMAEYEDNHFDLAIVDPPYGIGRDVWDNKPEPEYWGELFRVSKNQIVWGGNYFNLPIVEGWICWDKTYSDDIKGGKLTQGGCPRENMSDFELIWNSVETKAKFIRYTYVGNLNGFNDKLKVDYKQQKKIHITQKPIALYKWLLTKYAKQGDKILDTHVGSASSLIACEDMGFEYVGFEIDKDYYESAQKRLTQFRSQLKLEL